MMSCWTYRSMQHSRGRFPAVTRACCLTPFVGCRSSCNRQHTLQDNATPSNANDCNFNFKSNHAEEPAGVTDGAHPIADAVYVPLAVNSLSNHTYAPTYCLQELRLLLLLLAAAAGAPAAASRLVVATQQNTAQAAAVRCGTRQPAAAGTVYSWPSPGSQQQQQQWSKQQQQQ